MPATLSSFQSAVQLASGANLAIFALPKLGLQDFDIEDQRWSAALRAAEARQGANVLNVRQGRSEFQMKQIELEEKRGTIRALALASSLEAAVYLVWMSAFPDNPVDGVTIITLVLGAIPTLNLLANQREAKRLLKESRTRRLGS